MQDKDQPPIEVTPVARHLTRKKWLEPSDPGLFGSTPTKPNTGEQSRDVPSSSVSKSPGMYDSSFLPYNQACLYFLYCSSCAI